MTLIKNKYIELIRLQTAEEFFDGEVRSVVQQAISDYKKGSSYLSAYKFNTDRHIQYDNKHNAAKSRGCGCILCISRYELARARMAVNHYKKLYADFDLGLGDRLVAQYNTYKRNGGTCSIQEYFLEEVEKLKSILSGAKVRYQSAKDAIDDVLTRY